MTDDRSDPRLAQVVAVGRPRPAYNLRWLWIACLALALPLFALLSCAQVVDKACK